MLRDFALNSKSSKLVSFELLLCSNIENVEAVSVNLKGKYRETSSRRTKKKTQNIVLHVVHGIWNA